MEDRIRDLLDAIRKDEQLSWVVEQLNASFAEGISQSAKDASSQALAEFVAPGSLSTREKTKREKYETSRPYTEDEKLELTKFALKEVFLTLPAMKASTFELLRELGSTASSIEFTVPDEEEREEGSYAEATNPNRDSQQELSRRFTAFLGRISS
jgi:hypothetical protein